MLDKTTARALAWEIVDAIREYGPSVEIIAGVLQREPRVDTCGNPLATVVIHPECITEVPKGYDTVLGYLAKNQPEVLECFDYTDPTATLRDGYWLARRYSEQYPFLPKQYVPAPPVLRNQGIEEVRVYPVELLEQRWS